MSSLIFCFWRATVVTFLKNVLKLLKDKALQIILKYGRTEEKVGLEETYISHLYAYLLACFYKKHLKSLTSHIYFYLDNSELWKQYHQEMVELICDLETVKPQEIPIKVYTIFCYIKICYRGCGEETSFFAII